MGGGSGGGVPDEDGKRKMLRVRRNGISTIDHTFFCLDTGVAVVFSGTVQRPRQQRIKKKDESKPYNISFPFGLCQPMNKPASKPTQSAINSQRQ